VPFRDGAGATEGELPEPLVLGLLPPVEVLDGVCDAPDEELLDVETPEVLPLATEAAVSEPPHAASPDSRAQISAARCHAVCIIDSIPVSFPCRE